MQGVDCTLKAFQGKYGAYTQATGAKRSVIMAKLVYLVIACCNDCSDDYYKIDSAWTSERKAEKRTKELNKKGLEYWLENCSCGLFNIETLMINK